MKEELVTATKKIDGEEYAASVNFQVPESCDEMKEVWGDTIGVSNAIANARIGLQAALRRRIEKAADEAKKAGTPINIDQNAIAEELSGYKPGEAAAKKDPIEALLGKFASMPEEKQDELLKQLKAKASGK